MDDKPANSIFKNFIDIISGRVNLVTTSKQKRSLIVLIILIVGLVSGIVLVQKVQELREKALSPGALDQSVCYPANGPFSLNINNNYLPFPVGLVNVIEKSSEKVQISVLNQTEVVWGVTTRVVEEREWVNGELIEISRNFFTQSPNGTVCYFGEDVDIYSGGKIVGHSGAWRAGQNGARSGIMMPPQPVVGMTWIIEDAAPVAFEDAVVTSIGDTYVTPAGTFNDTIHISEDGGKSQKKYAPGIGMIFDDGLKLTSHTGGPTLTPTNTPTPTSPLPGDIDGDNDVDIFDYNLLVSNFGATNCGNVADIDPPAGGDCDVDIFDYNIVVSNFGK